MPLPESVAAAARAIRAEASVVPFFAVCGSWGHHRLLGVALAIADTLPEVDRPEFWTATGMTAPDSEKAAAMRLHQTRET